MEIDHIISKYLVEKAPEEFNSTLVKKLNDHLRKWDKNNKDYILMTSKPVNLSISHVFDSIKRWDASKNDINKNADIVYALSDKEAYIFIVKSPTVSYTGKSVYGENSRQEIHNKLKKEISQKYKMDINLLFDKNGNKEADSEFFDRRSELNKVLEKKLISEYSKKVKELESLVIS